MNKLTIAIIGVIVVAGGILALKSFYSPSVGMSPTPTTTYQATPRQLPTSSQITTPTPKLTPKTTVTPSPTPLSNILDKIEAAIRMKLKN